MVKRLSLLVITVTIFRLDPPSARLAAARAHRGGATRRSAMRVTQDTHDDRAISPSARRENVVVSNMTTRNQLVIIYD